MCGLAGFLNIGKINSDLPAVEVLTNMADAIAHRGPDSNGYWNDLAVGIGLAHCRLAILDVSPAGDQPMTSISGRYVIAFNGEIYNHLDLRVKLLAQKYLFEWRGHSDTETLLSCFDVWGVEETLKQTRGMFAFALWDRKLRVLTLGRDRFGEKPLYFGWQGQGRHAVFLFGSELSAIRNHPGFSRKIDRNSLVLYLRHNCIGGEHSIYEGIKKLPPGCLLTVSRAIPEPQMRAWWSVSEVIQRVKAAPFAGSQTEAVDVLEKLLLGSVKRQMLSDVPVGAFLSGGIDSSTIVALMQSQSTHPIKTFSIGFNEREYNEAVHAKAVASQLGTDHTELYVSADQALAVIPKLPKLYSEPFADSSQIPTFLVSELASREVKVSLSGDAGDELFCGYNRYQVTSLLWKRIKLLPRNLRRMLSRLITTLPPRTWDKIGRPLSILRLGDKLHKGSALLNEESLINLYRALTSHYTDPADMVIRGQEMTEIVFDDRVTLRTLNDVERMMLMDLKSYLPDDILTKVDRAAMGVGLETRIPFLDPMVVDFALSLPLDYKLREGITKWPLRQVLYRYVEPKLIERPKMGFGVPIDQWLRGPLRDWAEALLCEDRLRRESFFNIGRIRQKWEDHLSGRRNWQYQLWGILMFQAWLESKK